ncbi:hypothetical protein CCAX7_20250 [Capsulimonas corticalis]|uniref:histidine kinase n=1 Tax=Capsulimonas corticalis TaxID=2219043 RepID=A0A402D2I8_9BACT|nr:sensor histidine kinase [Capsulimonas corticalis]BDI29974.1 hypothetical protein CCAX7_20250 [Capsulimonas corticalis]
MSSDTTPLRQASDKAATVSLALTLVVLAMIGLLSYTSTQRFLANDRDINHSFAVVDTTRSVLSDLKDAETGQRGFLLTNDPQYLAPYQSGTASLQQHIEQLRLLVKGDAAQERRLETLETLSAEKLAELRQTIELQQSSNSAAALAEVRSNRGKDLMDQIRATTREMLSEERSQLGARTRSAEIAGERALLWVGGGFCIALMLVAVATGYVNKYLAERRSAEREVRAANAELEQRVEERTALLQEANKELEAFSYSVSHDLRAPLRHISGFADLLQKKSADQLDASSQRYIKTIRESAAHAGNLVDDLLTFSRMGRAEMRFSAANMEQIVEDVRRQMEIETEGRDIEWKIAPLPPVTGDPAMLRLVWQNLIGNAIKYSKTRERAVIEIRGETTPAETIFHIADNGVGFDMRYVDKLFGVFQRLHGKEEFEGTGIGLAQIRRIVSRHGGRAWAEGRLGEGATFSFSLPNTVKEN